jgi:excisionase family DNA binding protein
MTAAELFGGVRLDATKKSGSGDIPLVSILCLEHLTVPEVAALRRCSKSTVYHDVEAKRLKAYKLGGRLIFDRIEVLQWIHAHETIVSMDKGKRGLQ